EFTDGFRLVAGGLEVRDNLEIRHRGSAANAFERVRSSVRVYHLGRIGGSFGVPGIIRFVVIVEDAGRVRCRVCQRLIIPEAVGWFRMRSRWRSGCHFEAVDVRLLLAETHDLIDVANGPALAGK